MSWPLIMIALYQQARIVLIGLSLHVNWRAPNGGFCASIVGGGCCNLLCGLLDGGLLLLLHQLLLCHHDSRLHRVNRGVGQHVVQSLLGCLNLPRLVSLNNLVLFDVAIGTGGIVLGSLWVHFVMMNIHLEDLLDFKRVFSSALVRCIRLIHRKPILLHTARGSLTL